MESMSSSQNPGENLRNLLKQIFPRDADTQSTFANRIDRSLRADGRLSSLIYESTINYLVRRLILTAHFRAEALRVDGKEVVSEERLINDLRYYARNYLSLNDSRQVEKIVTFLRESIRTRKPIPDGLKKKIKKDAKRSKTACYICGRFIDYSAPKKTNNYVPDAPEVEHIWPNSLGGIHGRENLKMACTRCNQHKHDYIDINDFPYEHICMSSVEEEKIEKELGNVKKIDKKMVFMAKNSFCCANCNRSMVEVGELKLVRSDEYDSWHLLNVDGYCSNCYQRIYSRKIRK
jgi:5-methylcytosine-specific restriction endonuclease McrA